MKHPQTAAGLDELRIHDLRGTAASLMISSGANIKAVQRQLGHVSAAMTLDLYGHLYEDDLDASPRLSIVASPPPPHRHIRAPKAPRAILPRPFSRPQRAPKSSHAVVSLDGHTPKAHT
jgi:hypothetical protein